MRIRVNKDISKSEISKYLELCIKNKTEFYNLEGDYQYFNSSFNSYNDDLKYYGNLINTFVEFVRKNKIILSSCKKFLINSYSFVKEKNKEYIYINGKEITLANNMISIELNENIFYLPLNNTGNEWTCVLSIPVNCFDELVEKNIHVEFNYKISNKIENLDKYDIECVEKILYIFNIQKNDYDEIFYNHKNFVMLKKMLKVYDLFD